MHNTTLLFVARPAPQKGFTDLVDALERQAARNWRLNVLGELAQSDRLRLDRAASSVRRRVRLHGPQPLEQVAGWMRSSDVLVAPSWYENFGNVALEALSCGCPVLAPSLGGFRDLVEAPEHGLLYHPDHTGALAECLESMITRQPPSRRQRRAIGRHSQTYRWPVVADLTVAAIEDVLRRRWVC